LWQIYTVGRCVISNHGELLCELISSRRPVTKSSVVNVYFAAYRLFSTI